MNPTHSVWVDFCFTCDREDGLPLIVSPSVLCGTEIFSSIILLHVGKVQSSILCTTCRSGLSTVSLCHLFCNMPHLLFLLTANVSVSGGSNWGMRLRFSSAPSVVDGQNSHCMAGQVHCRPNCAANQSSEVYYDGTHWGEGRRKSLCNGGSVKRH